MDSSKQSSVGSASLTAAAKSTNTSTLPDVVEPTGVPDMSFTTAESVFTRLEATSGDVLTVSNVTVRALQDIDHEREVRGRKVRLFYFADHKMLIITIPTGPHEELHTNLEKWYLAEVGRMGLISSWRRTAARRYSGLSSTSSSGEGDSGGQPLPARRHKGAWPTLIFESGYSQTLESLRMKMRFWFAQSDHEVKIVLLAKAFPGSREKRILFEQWQERGTAPRPGAMTTRAARMIKPICLQTISVVWALETPYDEASEDERNEAASFNVTRGPLVLDFAYCFLREPVGPQEHDFVISDWELQTCAVGVWVLE